MPPPHYKWRTMLLVKMGLTLGSRAPSCYPSVRASATMLNAKPFTPKPVGHAAAWDVSRRQHNGACKARVDLVCACKRLLERS
jgi:hypothetical protein